MGKRGPPPKPLEQKRLEGTTRRDRDAARDNVPAALLGAPACPADFDAASRAVWDEVVPELLELKTLAKTDGGVLQGYCRTLARAVKLEKLANKEPIIKTPYGKKLHPAAAEARKLWAVVEKLAVQLGLSYAARSRVTMPKPDEKKDPTGAWLFSNAPPLSVVK